jgi:hypothetical protein
MEAPKAPEKKPRHCTFSSGGKKAADGRKKEPSSGKKQLKKGGKRKMPREKRLTSIRPMMFDGVRDSVARNNAASRDPIAQQIVRINALGLLTFDTQAGHSSGSYRERAYCFGFMRDRESALTFTEWVSLNTDAYASLVVLQGHARNPRARYVATDAEVLLRRTAGNFPVGADGDKIDTRVSPFALQANRYVAGDDHPPVPPDAVCVLCVDMVWGRHGDQIDGLFTAVEAGLKAHSKGLAGSGMYT